MQDWLPYLSPIAILVSAWWASQNAVKAINANREAHKASIMKSEEIARKKNAIDMIMRTQSDEKLQNVYKKIREMHESGEIEIAKLAYKKNNSGESNNLNAMEIAYVLNHFEHVANGINQEIFDEETIKHSQWGTITYLHKYCDGFIKTIRDQYSRPTIYMELEKLSIKWNEHPLTKNKT